MTITNDENASVSQVISTLGIPVDAAIKGELLSVFVFRPPEYYHRSLYDGYPGLLRLDFDFKRWIPDDGEYGLAFCGYGEKSHAPLAFYVEIPWDIYNRHKHPNVIAADLAVWKCAKVNSCATGIGIPMEKCMILPGNGATALTATDRPTRSAV